MNWSSRSLGSTIQHGIFRVLVFIGAIKPARALMRLVVLYYTACPSVRNKIRPYLLRRFPGANEAALRSHTRQLYLTFAEVLFARIKARATGQMTVLTDSASDAILRQAADAGHGAIILSAHVGAWQMALAGLEPFGKSIRLLQHIDKGDVDRHYFEGDTTKDINIINTCKGAEALIEATVTLRKGGFVCLMGDRITDADTIQVQVPFLGGTISVPGMPYLLASITGAKLIMCFTLMKDRIPCGVSARVIPIPKRLGRTQECLLPYARQFVEAIEAIVQDQPHQFFNFYDMWNNSHDQS